MVNLNSPGVYVIEKNISNYPVSINTSVVGIVGFASKGPTNVPTLVTSPQNLIDIFGKPSENITGQALEGAMEILETTNSVYFIRSAVAGDSLEASAAISIGSCPSLIISGNEYGTTNPLYLKVQVYDNLGIAKYVTPKEFSIPAGLVTTNQADALRAAIGGSLDADHFGVFDGPSTLSGALVGSYAGSGASLSVSAYSQANFTGQFLLLCLPTLPRLGAQIMV
jgi:hypothetical protein